MTIWYSQELTGIDSLPTVKPSASQYAGGVYVYEASVVLQAQAIADTIVIGVVPAGGQFLYGILNTDTSLGTSTISIGTVAIPAKYRAAATFTTTQTPTLFQLTGVTTNGNSLTATERQIITVAAAALPASGNLLLQMFWAAQG